MIELQWGANLYLDRGTPKALSRVAHWFREAGKAGDVDAQYLLASQYEAGEGVPQDLRLAMYWYDLAAKNGDEAAPFKLKELAERVGVPAT